MSELSWLPERQDWSERLELARGSEPAQALTLE